MKQPRSRTKASSPRKNAGGRGKPRSRWSKAYRERIERGEAKGKSRQAARGHPRGPGKLPEHIQRREYQRSVHGGITSAQKGAVTRFAGEQARRMGPPTTEEQLIAILRDQIRLHGYERFLAIRAARNRLRKSFGKRSHRPGGRVRGGTAHMTAGEIESAVDEMQDLVDEWEIEDWRLLFYR